jgi:hypothetical protein
LTSIDSEILEFLAEMAIQGNQKAISILDRLHLQPKEMVRQPLIVYAKDGEVAAWIV